jgi:hypothetical protein
MNMFISNGGRLLTAFACTGAAVLAWGGLLVATLGVDRASFWIFFTGQLIALTAYTLSIAFLPEVPREEGDR